MIDSAEFSSRADLVAFVNTNGIGAQIVSVVCNTSGEFVVFWRV